MIAYRWLDGDELSLLDPVIASRNWTPINRRCSRALIAEDDGVLVGFLVVRLIEHTEPLWIAPAYRGPGKGLARELSVQMADYLRSHGISGWMATSHSPYVAMLCEEVGMTRVTDPVYQGGR